MDTTNHESFAGGSGWSLEAFVGNNPRVGPVFEQILKTRGPSFEIPEFMAYELAAELDQTDFTMPGYNYVGPGTKSAYNILSKIRAKDALDEIALHHDLDMYLVRNQRDVQMSDQDAIGRSEQYVSIWSNPIGKTALENLLNRGFYTEPNPKTRIFDYLVDLHNEDERAAQDRYDSDDEKWGYETHIPTVLEKLYNADRENFLSSQIQSSVSESSDGKHVESTGFLQDHDYYIHDDM